MVLQVVLTPLAMVAIAWGANGASCRPEPRSGSVGEISVLVLVLSMFDVRDVEIFQ